MSLVAQNVAAAPTELTGTDPETGATYDYLVEVTPSMIDAWTSGGYCP
jgi:hypothetical protein